MLFGLGAQVSELCVSLASFRVFTILYYSVLCFLDEYIDDDDDDDDGSGFVFYLGYEHFGRRSFLDDSDPIVTVDPRPVNERISNE